MPPIDQQRCDIFTNTLFVAWTGEVLSCCHDLAGANLIGDLNTENLQEILHKKIKINTDGVSFEICQFCNDFYRFMNDKTPDGRWLADWIYDLYSTTDSTNWHSEGMASPGNQISSLSHWLYSLYMQEGQTQRLLDLLSKWIINQEQHLQSLTNKIQVFESQSDESAGRANQLQSQLDEIYHSHIWRIMSRLQRVRLAFIPRGSWRERIFQRLLRYI